MGTTIDMQQLLKSLCQNTKWMYAVFWRLNHQTPMLLTWEDGYFDNERSGGFLRSKSGFISFGQSMSIQNENSTRFLIEMAAVNMSCSSYQLGRVILGKVALTKTHVWTFAGEVNSSLLSESPEEKQLQFDTGIKTILLVPIDSIGVLQLGSLDTVFEDLTEVARIKNLFGVIQRTAGSCIPLSPRRSHLKPSIEIISTYPGITDNFSDLVSSQSPLTKDSTAHDFDPSIKSGLQTAPFQVQDELPLSHDIKGQIFRAGVDPCAGTWKSMFREVLVDHIGEKSVLNQSEYTKKILDSNMSNFSPPEDELNGFSSVKLMMPTKEMSDSNIKDWEHKDYDQLCMNVFSEEANSTTDGKRLRFPFDSELHKALGLDFLEEHDCVWNDKADEQSSLTAFGQTELRNDGLEFKEAAVGLTKKRGTEHLLDAVIADYLNESYDESSSNSSTQFPDSCLTQENELDTLGLQHSASDSRKRPNLSPKNEELVSSPTRSSSKSIEGQVEHVAHMRGGGNKRGNTESVIHKMKPQDRQLIQDRLKELRELIPNASKCSIDKLLDRTIKHMLFLERIPSEAAKLSAHPKVRGEGWTKFQPHTHKKGASWVSEQGNQHQECPLIIKNLDHSGQMLLGMQCKEYGLFLEMAQIIKRSNLSILNGVLESQCNKLWAHFVVEIPKGFHQMDALWPLMQLLQRNATVNQALNAS